MGRARDLTMGKARGQRRPQPGSSVEYTRLRGMTRSARAGTLADPADLLDAIRVVGSQRTRMRFAEGAAYNDACSAYFELTGEVVGPVVGTTPHEEHVHRFNVAVQLYPSVGYACTCGALEPTTTAGGATP